MRLPTKQLRLKSGKRASVGLLTPTPDDPEYRLFNMESFVMIGDFSVRVLLFPNDCADTAEYDSVLKTMVAQHEAMLAEEFA